MQHRRATQALRRAAGFILAAVAGRDLGGFYYHGGVVSYGTLLSKWQDRGNHGEILMHAARALIEKGTIRVVDDDRALIVANVPEDPEGGAEMRDRGGYFPEVVPLTTSRDPDDYDHMSHESMLPVGLGGSSPFEWDTFDVWGVDGDQLSAVSHIGRLLEGC